MLQAYPTKNGTGISIFGDYGDLGSLYETVQHIADSLDENNKFQKGQNQLLMNFAYEIRKAYTGNRLNEEIQFFGNSQKYSYYGFKIVWTDILIFINSLRVNAGYCRTNKQHQANLYMLEFIVEKALFEYDAIGANNLKDYISQGINVFNDYAFIIYQDIHIKFVSDKPGKIRFRKIPKLLGHFSEWTPEHKFLIDYLKKSAREQNVDITDLEFSEFPIIKW